MPGGETVKAFRPYPLPPQKPELQIDAEMRKLLHKTEHALSHLSLAGEMVPSLECFIYGFVKKEAVISS